MRLVSLLALVAAGVPLAAAPLPRDFAVERYEAVITPDLAAKRLSGEVTIHYRSRIARLEALELDAGNMEIASVMEGDVKQWFERKGPQLIVVLGKPALRSERRSVTIRYEAGAGPGLVFLPGQVYGALYTSDWMVSSDRPDERAALRLTVKAPEGLKYAATGIDTPAPPNLYGFAAGTFAETTTEADGIKLRVLGQSAALDATRAAMQFFAERTGKPFPAAAYTQVFVHGDAAAEGYGFSILPESYGAALAKNPPDLDLLARATAFQWYGVGIPCADWSNCWVNAALGAFLADAFLEQRTGKPRYESARQNYERLKADGKDQALQAERENPRSVREILAEKGDWVLHQLRRQLGDEVFWRGLRLYTGENWGRQASTDDFQKAMERVSHKNLGKFFERWVNGCCVK